jgi:hypothetical protein
VRGLTSLTTWLYSSSGFLSKAMACRVVSPILSYNWS